jgi:4-amino-4-deoxy-L-arabinose transferase-like glycosyltransferase
MFSVELSFSTLSCESNQYAKFHRCCNLPKFAGRPGCGRGEIKKLDCADDHYFRGFTKNELNGNPTMFESSRNLPNDSTVERSWWQEVEVALIIALVLGAYFLRGGEMPIQGEEPTRAQIALEMVQSGNWIVPCQQGNPFLTRAPFQNWLIAVSCLAFGSWDVWAVRFHSLMAVLLTTLVVYGYSRTFLTRLGALAAAASFATMGHMFTKGYQAETDALFIFLISGSLLLWHWGLVRSWPDALTFSCGYGLMALANLTKGLQGPLYFLGAITFYLVATKQWRRLFCKGHLVGILVGAAIHLAWIIPFAWQVGWSNALAPWFGDVAMTHNGSLRNWRVAETLLHLLTYPLEVWLAILPWSLLLLLYLSRSFRKSIREARPQVLFLSLSLAVALPTCWFPPAGLVRYFAPLYPCVAVLIGLAIQRCVEAPAESPLRAVWRWYLLTMACILGVTAIGLTVLAGLATDFESLARWAEPPFAAFAYASVFIALAIVVFRIRGNQDPARGRLAVLALSASVALIFTGVYTDARLRQSENPASAVRQLKDRLPPGQRLVSYGGDLDCLFAYHYGLPIIAAKPWPQKETSLDDEATYFCFNAAGNSRPKLPFAWKEIAAVSMDRWHYPVPERVVVVGCRLPVRDGAVAKNKF